VIWPRGHIGLEALTSLGAHGKRRSRDVEGVEFEVPKVPTPRIEMLKTSSGGERGYRLPNRLGGLRERRKLPQRDPGHSPDEKTILLLSKRVRTPLIATFVEN